MLAFVGTAVSTVAIAVFMWLLGVIGMSFRISFFHASLYVGLHIIQFVHELGVVGDYVQNSIPEAEEVVQLAGGLYVDVNPVFTASGHVYFHMDLQHRVDWVALDACHPSQFIR